MYPIQTAFQLRNTDYQPLLCCSLVVVQILSKFILAFTNKLGDFIDPNDCILKKDEVNFIVNCLSDLMLTRKVTHKSNESTAELIFSSVDELLESLKHVTSFSAEFSLVSPQLLDALLSLSLHSNNSTAKLALEVLWNLSLKPSASLLISNHENAISTLQCSWVTKPAFNDLTSNILWILGHGNSESMCTNTVMVKINVGYFFLHLQVR